MKRPHAEKNAEKTAPGINSEQGKILRFSIFYALSCSNWDFRIANYVRVSFWLDNFLWKNWCKECWFTIFHCSPIANAEMLAGNRKLIREAVSNRQRIVFTFPRLLQNVRKYPDISRICNRQPQ